MTLQADRARLLELLRTLSFERRKVVLASGKESDFYIDCKRTALTAEGHVLVGRLLFDRVRQIRPLVRAVGGLTLGADPIASAIAYTSFLEGEPVEVTPEELAVDLAARLSEVNQDLALAFESWRDLPAEGRRMIVEQAEYIAALVPHLRRGGR